MKDNENKCRNKIILPGDPKVHEIMFSEKRKLHGLFTTFQKEQINAQLFMYTDSNTHEIEQQLKNKEDFVALIKTAIDCNSNSK